MLARDSAAEKRLYDALRTSFGRDERTGIHLSALLNPLKTYWERKNGKPPLTDREIGFFTAGRGHEDIVARLAEGYFKSTEEEEIDGIHLRPDFVALDGRIIPAGSHAEFKTRRSNLPKDDRDAQGALSSYRDQIRGYMALKRQNEMYLIVLSLTEGKSKDPLSQSRPVIAVYRETMTEKELDDTLIDLLNRKMLLENGVSSLLPLCPAWQCGKWIKMGQGNDGGTHWRYQQLCPHYDACQPQKRDPNRGMKRENHN